MDTSDVFQFVHYRHISLVTLYYYILQFNATKYIFAEI